MTDGTTSNGPLRDFLARLLGWASERAIDLALRSIELGVNHRAALVLRGAGELVPLAWSLHRRTLGADRPFVVCDPRRGDMPASVRSPASCRSGVQAIAAASGGSLCVRTRWLPRDFGAWAARLQDADDVMLIVCIERGYEEGPLLVRPAPIRVPPIAKRTDDLPRIIDEYARDAVAELGAVRTGLTDADRAWVRKHAAASLAEIEKATLRLVAIRASTSPSAAAARLGMAPVSLLRWIARRNRP